MAQPQSAGEVTSCHNRGRPVFFTDWFRLAAIMMPGLPVGVTG